MIKLWDYVVPTTHASYLTASTLIGQIVGIKKTIRGTTYTVHWYMNSKWNITSMILEVQHISKCAKPIAWLHLIALKFTGKQAEATRRMIINNIFSDVFEQSVQRGAARKHDGYTKSVPTKLQ